MACGGYQLGKADRRACTEGAFEQTPSPVEVEGNKVQWAVLG